MKELIQKAKNLLADGKYKESIELIKKISEAIKNSITLCPSCDTEVVSLRKKDQVHAECPKCGAMWGHKEIKDELLKVKEMAMDKKDILSKLWKLYQEADPDVTPFDINSFDATGWLKKSLAKKVAGELGIKFVELSDLRKSDDEPVEDLIKKMSDDAQKWISNKIKFLVETEGLEQKQAVGKAYGMARQKFNSVSVKKSDALSKDDVIQIMLDMFKKNEEPNLINRHTITRYEATNEINTDVLKTVYRKAGKDIFELCKQEKLMFEALEKGKEKKGASLYEWKDEDHKKFEHGGYPFAVIGDKAPKGWKQTGSHFVDSSGVGREGEGALTQKQFHSKLKTGKAYGITGMGQFQVHVGEFERKGAVKKSDDIEKGGYEGTMVKEEVCKSCGAMIKADDGVCKSCGTTSMAKQMPRIKATTIAPKPGKAGKVTRSASRDTNLAIRAQKPITKADDGDNDDDDAPWSHSQKNMQRMIDSGQVWHMEGAMGRAAMEGIKSGHLILGPKGHKDYWGNHVPAHHEVKPGTHGSPEYAKEKTGYVHPDHVKKETKVKKSDDLEKRALSTKAQAKKLKEEINGYLQTKMYGHKIAIGDIGSLASHAEKVHASGKSPEDAASEAFDKFKQAGKITVAEVPVTKK